MSRKKGKAKMGPDRRSAACKKGRDKMGSARSAAVEKGQAKKGPARRHAATKKGYAKRDPEATKKKFHQRGGRNVRGMGYLGEGAEKNCQDDHQDALDAMQFNGRSTQCPAAGCNFVGSMRHKTFRHIRGIQG
jgi:hypothetical protein